MRTHPARMSGFLPPVLLSSNPKPSALCLSGCVVGVAVLQRSAAGLFVARSAFAASSFRRPLPSFIRVFSFIFARQACYSLDLSVDLSISLVNKLWSWCTTASSTASLLFFSTNIIAEYFFVFLYRQTFCRKHTSTRAAARERRPRAEYVRVQH